MEWYTQKEAADLLGVTKSTIYHYAKQGKIKKIKDPHRLYKEARYETTEIDILVSERKKQPTGLRPSEVAKYFGLSVQSILKYIQNGVIRAEIVPFGDERTSYIITEEAFQEAKEILQPRAFDRIRKGEYFHSSYDIGLFQHFQSPLVQTARVTKNDLTQDWGFSLPLSQKWIPYEEGIHKYKLQPVYSIHQESMPVKGYVYLKIPYAAEILYPFIDYLYQIWGVENIGIRELDQFILITLKAGERQFENVPFTVTDLMLFINEGTIELINGLLVVRSAYRKTNLELPIKMLDTIKQLAEDKDITISQWIEQELNNAIKKYC
ncbi:helix-turn-helix domain-containing protein (plasmid) [Cytobacillus solani]|uniref:helix-turn-helix domain-containing protein n=1 Tax=Cytobacillus solani TaxID=1637975 RepID=UPI002079E0A9|nr:helix-turn-helix domain-containing protein [Cytobacillus solani]USK57703.1 helix-turn-helix domain-containing protein [Cytobacillus solani]